MLALVRGLVNFLQFFNDGSSTPQARALRFTKTCPEFVFLSRMAMLTLKLSVNIEILLLFDQTSQ